MLELDSLCQSMLGCQECGLSKSRTQVVPGDGPENAKIMFIGEAPGVQEDRQGLPFVGPAGQYLGELLASVGLKREDVYICNVVKCRPPQNRDPLPTEIAACKHWLDAQIDLIKPTIIATLGRFSMARYFPGESISRIHGQPRRRGQEDVIYFPMYHPAAALHQQSLKPVLEDDMRKLAAMLKEEAAIESQSDVAENSSQLSLF